MDESAMRILHEVPEGVGATINLIMHYVTVNIALWDFLEDS